MSEAIVNGLYGLVAGFLSMHWSNPIMIVVGLILLYLGIKKDIEPVLLVPIGFGCILVNIPLAGLIDKDGFLRIIYVAGILTELFPLLIFVGIGAMTDFGPLLENPKIFLLGAAGQFGIFLTLGLALALGFTKLQAVSIGIIGACDGPTAIYVTSKYAPELLGAIMLGNFMKECGVVSRLTKASENEIANIVTLLLGISIGATMDGRVFLKSQTLIVLALGFLAICLDTACGVLFGKVLKVLTGGKVNPLIGAAGISAYPMSARVVQREGQKYNPKNYLLMHAMGAT